ncbi:hypothetical protein RMSM_07295 [Rhodopirellula maiorica SM1]|uniref:Uncharacterized protein n=1 Tax=Rhodopirellula maiorica SM1 TaxID=1265738 RepID=M5R8G2_9BACT|nr:hypothetical protein RMSM_07295 [Rhodopirellula maiorica SM1]
MTQNVRKQHDSSAIEPFVRSGIGTAPERHHGVLKNYGVLEGLRRLE